MEDIEKNDHASHTNMLREQFSNSGSNGAPLTQTRTITLNDEQYERLFFQPGAPRRGDLAKRFGKPKAGI